MTVFTPPDHLDKLIAARIPPENPTRQSKALACAQEK